MIGANELSAISAILYTQNHCLYTVYTICIIKVAVNLNSNELLAVTQQRLVSVAALRYKFITFVKR